MNRNRILNTILPSHEAREIAEDCGYTSEQEGAEFYFNEVYYEGEWHIGDLPKYKQFVKKIEGGDLFYDYGADYYFLVQTKKMNESKMKKNKKEIIRLTESDLHKIIKESVNKVLQVMPLKEDRMKPFSEYENMPDYNRHRLHTLDRTTDFHSDCEKGDHAYCDSGELYPSADFTDVRKDFGFSNDADSARNFLAQKDFNKKWENMQDRLKYTKQANSRPLHRKGSLNREL